MHPCRHVTLCENILNTWYYIYKQIKQRNIYLCKVRLFVISGPEILKPRTHFAPQADVTVAHLWSGMEGAVVSNLIDFDSPPEGTAPSAVNFFSAEPLVPEPASAVTMAPLLPEPMAPTHSTHRGDDEGNDTDATESADSENDDAESPSHPSSTRRSSSCSSHSAEDPEETEIRVFIKSYVERLFHGRWWNNTTTIYFWSFNAFWQLCVKNRLNTHCMWCVWCVLLLRVWITVLWTSSLSLSLSLSTTPCFFPSSFVFQRGLWSGGEG